MKKEILIFFTALILVLGFLNILYAADAGTTANAAGEGGCVGDSCPVPGTGGIGGTTATATMTELSDGIKQFSVPVDAKGPANIGKELGLANPSDATLQGGTLIFDPKQSQFKFESGGEITVKGAKQNLGDSGSFKIKDSIEVSNAGKGSFVEGKIEKGNSQITELDIKAKEAKAGDRTQTEVKVQGKTQDTKLKLPAGSELKRSELVKSDTNYNLEIKEKTKLEMPKTEKKSKASDNPKAVDSLFAFNSRENKMFEISSEISDKIGIDTKDSKFVKGNGLSYDPAKERFGMISGERYNSAGTADNSGIRFFNDQGKESLHIPNLASNYKNLVTGNVYFFGESDALSKFNMAAMKKDGVGGGIIFDKANNKIFTFSATEGKLSLAVVGFEGNPWNGKRFLAISKGDSGIVVGKDLVEIRGDGTFYAGQGAAYSKDGGVIRFNPKSELADKFGKSLGYDFSVSKGYKEYIISENPDGTLMDKGVKILSQEENGKIINKLTDFDGRVLENTNPAVVPSGQMPQNFKNTALGPALQALGRNNPQTAGQFYDSMANKKGFVVIFTNPGLKPDGSPICKYCYEMYKSGIIKDFINKNPDIGVITTSDSGLMKKYDIKGIPASIVFGSDGAKGGLVQGTRTDADAFSNEIRRNLSPGSRK